MGRTKAIKLQLDERAARALLASVERSLKKSQGALGWDGDKKALETVRDSLYKALGTR